MLIKKTVICAAIAAMCTGLCGCGMVETAGCSLIEAARGEKEKPVVVNGDGSECARKNDVSG